VLDEDELAAMNLGDELKWKAYDALKVLREVMKSKNPPS
jgi:hypothetical protein